jgi:ABC-type hemin transport system ATPase subunit
MADGARSLVLPGRSARRSEEDTVDDQEIISRIGDLADEERLLEEQHVGEGLSSGEEERLKALEVTLDQLWDLLRQRRALRSAGRDPDRAAVRSEGIVEEYRQ